VFCTKFNSEFHSALRGCLGRIEDPLALKPLPVCARCLCEVYLRGRPYGKGIHQKPLQVEDLVGRRSCWATRQS
jgi:hypothetical protein